MFTKTNRTTTTTIKATDTTGDYFTTETALAIGQALVAFNVVTDAHVKLDVTGDVELVASIGKYSELTGHTVGGFMAALVETVGSDQVVEIVRAALAADMVDAAKHAVVAARKLIEHYGDTHSLALVDEANWLIDTV